MDRKRVVLLGYGLLGREMAKIASHAAWIEVVGVIDKSPDALNLAFNVHALERGCLSKSVSYLIKRLRPDIVFISTPSEIHCSHVLTCLRHGCDVLVAKPLANTYKQGMSIVRQAALLNRKVAVGRQIQFSRHYQAVKKFIASNSIGKIENVIFLNSKPRPDVKNLGSMKHPALLEMSCHHFDTLFALFPQNHPQSIFARGCKPSWSAYDGVCMINAIISMSDNLNVLYHCGFSATAPHYELRLEGSKGVLRCRGSHMSAVDFSYEISLDGKKFENIDLESEIPHQSAWDVYFDMFYDYIHRNIEPPFSAVRNLPVLELITAGIRSVATGKVVEVC